MPLEHLIHNLNRQLVVDHGLDLPPLRFDGQRVHGRFGDMSFTSDFKPIRLGHDPAVVSGHDAGPLRFTLATVGAATERFLNGAMPDIVSLDRLSRTVHMLNYLVLDRPAGSLFLHVHPHHVLAVKRDHGAYFEDIIHQCGLPLRRIVIGLSLGAAYQSQLPLLMERFRGYRERGYATALKFADEVGETFVERFRRELLHRFAPDHVRFSARFFADAYAGAGGQRRLAALLAAVRGADGQILIDDIRTVGEAQRLAALRPEYVQGEWYEREAEPAAGPRLAAAG
ncbi:hypothetical protein JCM19379_12490 [Methyloparacoccus murrellii]